ncbi:MAG: hypothetical protein V3T86_14230 [Planctomycetota bacterium]
MIAPPAACATDEVPAGTAESGESSTPKAAKNAEDYVARMFAGDWADLEELDEDEFVSQMQEYIKGDKAGLNDDRPEMQAMMFALVRMRPKIAPLRALVGPRDPEKAELDDAAIKRDFVAVVVVDSFMIRASRKGARQEELYDAIVSTGVNFSFDPLWGNAETRTANEVAGFMLKRAPLKPLTIAAVTKHLEPLIEKWRGRATTSSTPGTISVILRYLGADGADRLFQEWERMKQDERLSLLDHIAYGELNRSALSRLADLMIEKDLELREAALKALEQHGAPVTEVDAGSRDRETIKAQRGVRAWIAKTLE